MARSDFDGDRSDAVWGSAAWVTRDQFVHFVTLAHQHGEVADWPRFRLKLVAALNAAWGLDTRWGHRSSAQNDWVTARRHRRALAVLDQLRDRIDPADEWPAFFDALWAARTTIRADIVPPVPRSAIAVGTVRSAVGRRCAGHRRRPRLRWRTPRPGRHHRRRGPRW